MGSARLLPDSADALGPYWSGARTVELSAAELWAIPYRIETHRVIYNKGGFKAAGLDPDKPPETRT